MSSKTDSGGVVDSVLKFLGLKSKKPQTPVPSFLYRVENSIKYSWRGLFGFFIPLIFIPTLWSSFNNAKKVEIMWYTMLWFFLVRPVNVPATGVIPLCFLPMTGVYSTADTCHCYMSENIVLYLMGSILILLLNNSGVDRRIALYFLAHGDNADQYTARKLVIKAGVAAFFLGFLSSRMISSAIITEYITRAMMSAETSYGKAGTEPNIRELRHVINNAIQTCSCIGGTVMIHSSYGILAFRSLFCERAIGALENSEYPDIFNYLQYSAFAMPLAVITVLVNFLYFSFIIGRISSKRMPVPARQLIQKQLKDHQKKLPRKSTLHEKLSIFFLVVTLFFMYYRWSDWLGGWSTFQQDEKLTYKDVPLPAIRDATVAAFFVVLLHALPMNYNFTKYFTAKKRRHLPPLKPESGILWWRFCDKNLNYSYFFLIGAGNALVVSMIKSGLSKVICENSGQFLTDKNWNFALLIVAFGAAIMANIMPSTAALCIYLPFILALADGGPAPWPTHIYLPSLAVGLICNYGFCYPFRYSPAHNCYYVGKTPIKKMIRYGSVSMLICMILVYLAVAFVAPAMWDPENVGIPPCSAGEPAPEEPPAA